MVVGFALGPASIQSIEFFSFDPAYMLCNLQLMVRSASIRKPSCCLCVSFLFYGEKASKERSSAMDTWREGNCSKGRSSNSGLDNEA